MFSGGVTIRVLAQAPVLPTIESLLQDNVNLEEEGSSNDLIEIINTSATTSYKHFSSDGPKSEKKKRGETSFLRDQILPLVSSCTSKDSTSSTIKTSSSKFEAIRCQAKLRKSSTICLSTYLLQSFQRNLLKGRCSYKWSLSAEFTIYIFFGSYNV